MFFVLHHVPHYSIWYEKLTFLLKQELLKRAAQIWKGLDVFLVLLTINVKSVPFNLFKNGQIASWSSGKAFVSGAGDMRFQSRASQIGHSVANDFPQ